MDWSWHMRGIVDRLFGGVECDANDDIPRTCAWVTRLMLDALKPPNRRGPRRCGGNKIPDSRLARIPGRRWPTETLLTQTASFGPNGLLGLAYWYVFYPVPRSDL